MLGNRIKYTKVKKTQRYVGIGRSIASCLTHSELRLRIFRWRVAHR